MAVSAQSIPLCQLPVPELTGMVRHQRVTRREMHCCTICGNLLWCHSNKSASIKSLPVFLRSLLTREIVPIYLPRAHTHLSRTWNIHVARINLQHLKSVLSQELEKRKIQFCGGSKLQQFISLSIIHIMVSCPSSPNHQYSFSLEKKKQHKFPNHFSKKNPHIFIFSKQT